MKKPTPRLFKKLMVSRQTIRALGNIELIHVAGGETGDKGCPLLAESGKELCPTRGGG